MVPRGTVIAIVVVLLGVIVFDVSGPAWIVNYPGPTALVTGGAMTLLAAVLTGTRGPKPPEPDERPPWSTPTTIEPEPPPPRRHAREDS